MTTCMPFWHLEDLGVVPHPPKVKTQTMKFTFHKWDLKFMTGPNPTQDTKFDKYRVTIHKTKCLFYEHAVWV